jgi:hypothetical protein
VLTQIRAPYPHVHQSQRSQKELEKVGGASAMSICAEQI